MAAVAPQLPRALASVGEAVEHDALLDGVGGHPEAVVGVGEHAALVGQAREHVGDEVLAGLDVVEQLTAHHEIPAVLADPHRRDGVDVADVAALVGVDDVEGRLRRHREQARERVGGLEAGDDVVQRGVGQHVGVVGHEVVVVAQVLAHPAQPLPDRRLDPGVHEGDPPVRDVGLQRGRDAGVDDEVVGVHLLVVQEVAGDVPRAIAHREDELGVAEVRVVAHDVPDERPVTDHRHGLGHVVDAVAHAHAVAAAEEHDLHRAAPGPSVAPGSTTCSDGIAKTSLPPHSATSVSCAEISARRFHGSTST